MGGTLNLRRSGLIFTTRMIRAAKHTSHALLLHDSDAPHGEVIRMLRLLVRARHFTYSSTHVR
jgi:hypothetical protein